MKKNKKYYLRKTHRYLGVLIGIQFLLWTISGLYFTWTDLDEIHGDHYLKGHSQKETVSFTSSDLLPDSLDVHSLELKFINEQAYLWINDSILMNKETGNFKGQVSEDEAKSIARSKIKAAYRIQKVNLLTKTDAHHEFRGRRLPVWQIEFEGDESLTAYVDYKTGDFETVRHRDWRWFDFLWMTHTMDYQSRDDFNNTLIRAFSAFGLLTVCSGFLLFFVTGKPIGSKKRKKSSKK